MKIRINKIKLFGYHGVYKIEKEKGQNFIISVEIKIVDTDYKDKIENTVDYMGIVDIVKDVFSAKRYNLIETLSVDISNKIISMRLNGYENLGINYDFMKDTLDWYIPLYETINFKIK